MALKRMYAVRCSPDCPYEDCIILMNVPPMSQSSMPGMGGQEGEENGESNNQSNADSRAGGSGNSQYQTGKGQEGSGASQNGASGEHSQDNQASSGTGGGADRSDQDQRQDNAGSSGSSTGENRQQQSRPTDNERTPKQKEQPGEKRPDPGTDQSGNGGDSQKNRDKSPEEQKREHDEQKQRRQEEEQRRKEAEQRQQDQPQPVKFKEVQVEQNIQYSYEWLPQNFKQGPPTSHGSRGTLDNTGIANLGRHKHRETILTDAVFQARLKNVMKDNAFDRPVRGRKRGRLDMRSLYKVPMKAENVFTLKEARKNKHYNVILLVDQSGSMYDGYKMQEAANMATFLARSLDKVDVNYAVIGYSSDWAYHKKFTQMATDDTLKKLKYDLQHTGGGGTALFKPMKEAFQVLKKAPTHRNIVISISDGEPNEDPKLIRQYVRGNARIADYIDIGINSRPIMENGFNVRSVDELKPLLIRELKRRIKRG